MSWAKGRAGSARPELLPETEHHATLHRRKSTNIFFFAEASPSNKDYSFRIINHSAALCGHLGSRLPQNRAMAERYNLFSSESENEGSSSGDIAPAVSYVPAVRFSGPAVTNVAPAPAPAVSYVAPAHVDGLEPAA